jgi:hypothetical protein
LSTLERVDRDVARPGAQEFHFLAVVVLGAWREASEIFARQVFVQQIANAGYRSNPKYAFVA